MNILGINDHHNSSVALMINGRLICAMQEERFTREKNFWGMPKASIHAALDFAGLVCEDLDQIVFAGQRHSANINLARNEHLKLLKNSVQMDLIDGIRGRSEVPVHLIFRRKINIMLRQGLQGFFYERDVKTMQKGRQELLLEYFPRMVKVPISFIEHHTCHYSTALYGGESIDKPVLVFTNDNQGDKLSASVSIAHPDGRRELLSKNRDRDSIGMLWGLVTLLMGFVPLEHEYKLMGMAPYASPESSRKIADAIADLFSFEEGVFKIKLRSVQSVINLQPIVNELYKIMRFQRFDAVCGGLQLFTEEALSQWIKYWVSKTEIGRICCAGGTFMNIKANKEIMGLDVVKDIFVFPSCGDETNSIGACYHAHAEKTGHRPDSLRNFYLGREWSEQEIISQIGEFDTGNLLIERHDNIEPVVAELLADDKVVARFHGREEFGARALGNRSILANPSRWSVISEINDMIKKRDFWMPFACSILEEDCERYLRGTGKNVPLYMIMAFDGGEEIASIVAGTHPRDHTVRPQLVRQAQAPGYHAIISNFKDLTGIGGVLNTSFNLHGWPLVHSPTDALTVLNVSGLRYLALGNYLISKV